MAVNSVTEAFLIYKDYCSGNKKGTSALEMGRIIAQYSDYVPRWKAQLQASSDDENQYEFDDVDKFYYNEGQKMGKDATGGYERGDGSTAHVAVDATGSVLGAVGGLTAGKIFGNISKGGINAASRVGSAALTDAGGNAAAKAGENAAGKSIEGVGKKCISAYFAITLAVITAAIYWIKKPNKEGANACEALMNPLGNGQGALAEAQSTMETNKEEISALSEEASEMNEETNQEIIDKKTEHDLYMETYKALQEKIDYGEGLTKSEKSLYKNIVGYINETGVNIQELQDETSEEVNDIYDDMAYYQDDYDCAAETIAEVQGLTDYVASFDTQTKVLSYVEAASQGLNAASATKAATQLVATAGLKWWNYVIAAAGFAAAASSGIATVQQMKFAKTASDTEDLRETTETTNISTSEIYDAEISDYEAIMVGVEELELITPKDIEPVEETSETSIEMADGSSDSAFGFINNDNDNDKNNDNKPKKNNSIIS